MRRFLWTVMLCWMLPGCTSVSFYWQALNGQWELSRRARAIDEVIAEPGTNDILRARLAQVQKMRAFASAQLGLPDNKSYRKYADLKRPYVVWNVFAATEFSVRPQEWCFPFAGCVGYRGYFHEETARAFAEELRKQGFDVFVGGIPAYSTLGYFDDPVLNTFIGYPENEVARLIFHELAHQVVYLKGDSTFNESFATAVELEGVKRWIIATGNADQQLAFDEAQGRKRDFLALIEKHKKQLATLYEETRSVEEKRTAKARVFAQIREEYATLKQRWGGFAGYDFWFNQPLNNAQLASLALYTQLVPGFQRVLEAQQSDLAAFYREVKRLSTLSADQRQAALAP